LGQRGAVGVRVGQDAPTGVEREATNVAARIGDVGLDDLAAGI
jgi:hypothetical protein